jgi:hypothetical protein
MRVKLNIYQHSSNGLSLQLMPETQEEFVLLKGLWKHGKLKTGHPSDDKVGNPGHYINWDLKE